MSVVANLSEDCEDKFSCSDPATRRPEGETSEQNTEVAEESTESMLKHVPNVPLYQCFPATPPLETRPAEHLDQGVDEKRALQVLVTEEFYPITQLKDADSFITAIRQVFEYYRRLYEEAHLMHGDVTLNSIMYRKQNGQINGVLRDYDLSLFCNISKDRSNSLQRTGTKSYVAIDLLKENPISHFYRHDLESLFYGVVILTSRYHDGREIDNAPYADWFTLGSKYLKSQKISLISGPQEEVMLTPSFEKLVRPYDDVSGRVSSKTHTSRCATPGNSNGCRVI
ncbi:hypothetical protein BDN70DRAFT_881047 [Pholiota conissans]|uniref:Fungal-type protein kinase domain-containing protein n=1 Tax=Pholiota conissans TaxID=109636 RepID=A0A9P6CSP8_9AGAR|nr:hypothetical protein BDN70DRAFT_881047 [Pholiota conissans]